MVRKIQTGLAAAALCVGMLGVAPLLSVAAPAAGGQQAAEQAGVSAVQGDNWSVSFNADGSLDVVDMWDNELTLPGTVEKIYSSSPIGTYMDYVINPDLLIGWNSQLSEEAQKYIREDVRDLMVLGGSSNNNVDTEYVVNLEPDVIVAYGAPGGSISATITTLGEMTDIPILFLDSDLMATADAIRFLGVLTGNEERAEELAAYIDEKLEMVAEVGASVPENARKTLYYATSADGLSTAGSNSMHTEVLDLIGIENVAGDDATYTNGSTVSLENVLEWDPDVILCYNADFYASVADNPDWSDVAAVRDGAVFAIPSQPFNWFDRPPCIARVLGAEYVLYKVYPEYVTFDMAQEVIDFYDLFYQVEITEDDALALIGA